MRLATFVDGGRHRVAVVRSGRLLPADPRLTIGALAADPVATRELRAWADAQPADDGIAVADVALGPAVPDPGAIYTIGLNYDGPGAAPRPAVPLVYGKAASSVGAPGATLSWDRSVSDDVDAEVELGVVVGVAGGVLGYTCVNDISARDPALDGDQWLLGKSLPGFCPVGPWIVTADELDPTDLALGCRIDDRAIQDGRTSQMRVPVGEILRYLGRHLELRPGDLIATGTPVRLATPPGPGRRLRAGDRVTVWIEGIGELTTHIA